VAENGKPHKMSDLQVVSLKEIADGKHYLLEQEIISTHFLAKKFFINNNSGWLILKVSHMLFTCFGNYPVSPKMK
jgi:hypothetical protein